jgi:hypothetical protein
MPGSCVRAQRQNLENGAAELVLSSSRLARDAFSGQAGISNAALWFRPGSVTAGSFPFEATFCLSRKQFLQYTGRD